MRSHSSYLFDIGQSLLLDFGSLVRSHSSHSSCLFHTGQSLLVDFGSLVRSHSSFLFDIGQLLLVDFDLCAPTRLVFFTLVNQLEENKTLSYTT